MQKTSPSPLPGCYPAGWDAIQSAEKAVRVELGRWWLHWVGLSNLHWPQAAVWPCWVLTPVMYKCPKYWNLSTFLGLPARCLKGASASFKAYCSVSTSLWWDMLYLSEVCPRSPLWAIKEAPLERFIIYILSCQKLQRKKSPASNLGSVTVVQLGGKVVMRIKGRTPLYPTLGLLEEWNTNDIDQNIHPPSYLFVYFSYSWQGGLGKIWNTYSIVPVLFNSVLKPCFIQLSSFSCRLLQKVYADVWLILGTTCQHKQANELQPCRQQRTLDFCIMPS